MTSLDLVLWRVLASGRMVDVCVVLKTEFCVVCVFWANSGGVLTHCKEHHPFLRVMSIGPLSKGSMTPHQCMGMSYSHVGDS